MNKERKMEEKEEKKPIKVDYVFCIPWHPSSGIQSVSAEMARANLTSHGKTIALQPAFSANVYMSRNGCLGPVGCDINQKPFQSGYDYDRLIWIDADNIINAAQIDKLISYDVDIAAAWYRIYTVGDINDDNITSCGLWDYEERRNGSKGVNQTHPYTVGQMRKFAEKDELIEVDYSGLGLMVIKKGVFEALEFPWFQAWSHEWEVDGKVNRQVMTDDAGFCLRAKWAGFKVMVAPQVSILHEKKVLL